MSLRPGSRRAQPRRAAVLVALLAVTIAAAAAPAATGASSPSPATAAAELLRLTNADRVAAGLRPLRADGLLARVARGRASNLAAAGTFTHAAAGGDLSLALAGVGVQWYSWAENLAWVSGGLDSATAATIHGSWMASPPHRDALLSETLNYAGFGVAVRSDGRVFASGVFSESRDHSAPSARIRLATRSGSDLEVTWSGYDAPLQTHWAGLRDFDVWYRVDDGAWRRIRDDTTATSLHLGDRPSGHRYWLRVQARDRAGNVGAPSAAVSIWVP